MSDLKIALNVDHIPVKEIAFKLTQESVFTRISDAFGIPCFHKKCARSTKRRRKETQRKKAARHFERFTSLTMARGVSWISWKQIHHILTGCKAMTEKLSPYSASKSRQPVQKRRRYSRGSLYVCAFVIMLVRMRETKEDRRASDDPVRHWLAGISTRERLLSETTARDFT